MRIVFLLLLLSFSPGLWAQTNWCGSNVHCQKQFQTWAHSAIIWKHTSLMAKWRYLGHSINGVGGSLIQKQVLSLQDITSHLMARLGFIKRISPFDPLIQRYSKKYSFDWPLIAAQIYQESRFDPNARSHAGAQGLMQLMPKTAKELGYETNLTHPEISIQAGVRYMAWLKKRFAHLPKKQRKWFMLGAYNAGIGHIRDAQRLAKRLGYRNDIWFGHVEKALLLLSKPSYAKQARYGWVRGKEPVNYVRAIRKYYRQYVAHLRA